MTDLQPALGPDRDAPAGLTVGRMIRMLARQWFVIPLCVIVAVAGSVAYSRFAPRHYEAFVGVSLGVPPSGSGGGSSSATASGAPSLPNPDAEIVSASVVHAAASAAHVAPQEISLAIFYNSAATSNSSSGPTGAATIAATATTPLAAEEAAAAAAPAFVAQRTTDLRGEVTTQIQQLNQVQTRLNDLQSGKQVTGPIGSLTYNPTGPISAQIAVVNSLYQSLYNTTIQLQVLASSVGVTHSVTAAQLVGISTSKRAAEAAAAGLLVGIGLALLRDGLRDRATDPFEVRGLGGVPVLGSLPRLRNRSSSALVDAGGGSLTEAYRTIRTAVMLQTPGRQNVLLVVSAGRGEGRTSVAANLATAFARTGASTLLVDADFRHPAAAESFDIPEDRDGLAELLRHSRTVAEDEVTVDAGTLIPEDAFVATDIPNLSVLPPGNTGPGSPELLSAEALEKLDWILRQRFEMIIIDTPAMTEASDAVALTPRADGCVFVFSRNRSTRRGVSQALESLRHTPVRLLGTVITHKGRLRLARSGRQDTSNRPPGSSRKPLAHSGRGRRRR